MADMNRSAVLLDAPTHLGLRPPAPSAVPGCVKLAGALRDQDLPARLGAREGGVLTPPRYDRGDWQEGDGVFPAPASPIGCNSWSARATSPSSSAATAHHPARRRPRACPQGPVWQAGFGTLPPANAVGAPEPSCRTARVGPLRGSPPPTSAGRCPRRLAIWGSPAPKTVGEHQAPPCGRTTRPCGYALALRRLGRYGLAYLDGSADPRHPGNSTAVGAAAGEGLAQVTGRGQADLTDLTDLEGLRPYPRTRTSAPSACATTTRTSPSSPPSASTTPPAATATHTVLDHLESPELDGFRLHLDADPPSTAPTPAASRWPNSPNLPTSSASSPAPRAAPDCTSRSTRDLRPGPRSRRRGGGAVGRTADRFHGFCPTLTAAGPGEAAGKAVPWSSDGRRVRGGHARKMRWLWLRPCDVPP